MASCSEPSTLLSDTSASWFYLKVGKYVPHLCKLVGKFAVQIEL